MALIGFVFIREVVDSVCGIVFLAVLKVDHQVMDLGDDLIVQVLNKVGEVELSALLFVVFFDNETEGVIEDGLLDLCLMGFGGGGGIELGDGLSGEL